LCRSIYSAIIEGHLSQGGFSADVIFLGPKLVDATLELHRNVMNNLLPSAVKFHYQFNLRELSAHAQVSRNDSIGQ
jgi:dynein heavy chain